MALTALVCTLIGTVLGVSAVSGQATGGMQEIAIDMNTAGNTATSLGTRQECLDALPGETITVDVTARGIPAATAMITHAYTLSYDGPLITITGQEPLLIRSSPGSSLFNASDSLPDFDGAFAAAVVDLRADEESSESGDGVLDRLTIEISADAGPGTYLLALSAAGHIDDQNIVHAAQSILDGRIALGVSCSSSTPVPPKTQAPQGTPDPGATDPPATPTAPATGSTGDSPAPGTEAPSPSTGPGDSITPTGSPSTLSPSPTPGGSSEEGDEDGGLNAGTIAIVAIVALAIAAAAGWLAYRRLRSGPP